VIEREDIRMERRIEKIWSGTHYAVIAAMAMSICQIASSATSSLPRLSGVTQVSGASPVQNRLISVVGGETELTMQAITGGSTHGRIICDLGKIRANLKKVFQRIMGIQQLRSQSEHYYTETIAYLSRNNVLLRQMMKLHDAMIQSCRVAMEAHLSEIVREASFLETRARNANFQEMKYSVGDLDFETRKRIKAFMYYQTSGQPLILDDDLLPHVVEDIQRISDIRRQERAKLIQIINSGVGLLGEESGTPWGLMVAPAQVEILKDVDFDPPFNKGIVSPETRQAVCLAFLDMVVTAILSEVAADVKSIRNDGTTVTVVLTLMLDRKPTPIELAFKAARNHLTGMVTITDLLAVRSSAFLKIMQRRKAKFQDGGGRIRIHRRYET
jgi:hypothetical protein